MSSYGNTRWKFRLPYFQENEKWNLVEFLQWSMIQYPNDFGNKEEEHRTYKICCVRIPGVESFGALLSLVASKDLQLPLHYITTHLEDYKFQQMLDLQTDFNEALTNTTRESIKPALKRKSTVIDESDSDATKTDESTVSNAPEDIEDVLTGDNIIDDEQVVKNLGVQRNNSWLAQLLHQYREDLATTTIDLKSLSQVAET
ncbi:5428_t:CDS:2, partial [Funneliformis geosporum]